MLSQFTAQGKCLRTCMENIHNFSKVTERKKRGKQGRPLVESSFLTRDQALSLSSGSTDSKTLDYQRTNPREYQIVRTHCKESTSIQDLAPPNHQWHPVQDASSKQQTNKQNTNPIISRQDYHLTQPCPSEEKQTKTQHKSHPIQSLHKPLDQS